MLTRQLAQEAFPGGSHQHGLDSQAALQRTPELWQIPKQFQIAFLILGKADACTTTYL